MSRSARWMPSSTRGRGWRTRPNPYSPSVRTADHTLLVKEHVLEVGKLTQVGAPCHKWVTLTLTSGQVIAGHTCQMVKAKGQPRLRE